MKVALIGYGKMGKTIEKILLNRGHEIGLRITSSNLEDLCVEKLKSCDLAIEFSKPENAINNYLLCFAAKIPVVSGTTGWLKDLAKVKEAISANEAAMFYAPNFSIGVNIFFKVNAFLAKLMNPITSYEVEMEEIHHTQKLDSPSGTGIRCAEIIIDELDRKSSWVENVKSSEKELLIKVKREDKVPGTHIVEYISEVDKISLGHTAFSREGFAMGAVLAAEFLLGKTGYFEMDDLLKF
ncbi:MAG: 4-hydroxy-tetrahydrodipicolinate reductase [Bacteroidetes bacterium]|nr:4-hydroxy-tetrahydrodipicolinate reductase [Bacteroidota bacterium]